jgi:hypothetical protein
MLREIQYKTAYLLTYYLIHLRAEPSSRPFRQFLEALRQTLDSNDLKERTFRTGKYALSPSECVALESAMILAYAERGLEIVPLAGHPLKN